MPLRLHPRAPKPRLAAFDEAGDGLGELNRQHARTHAQGVERAAGQPAFDLPDPHELLNRQNDFTMRETARAQRFLQPNPLGALNDERERVMRQTDDAQEFTQRPVVTATPTPPSTYALLGQTNAQDGQIVSLGAKRYRKTAVGWVEAAGAEESDVVGRDGGRYRKTDVGWMQQPDLQPKTFVGLPDYAGFREEARRESDGVAAKQKALSEAAVQKNFDDRERAKKEDYWRSPTAGLEHIAPGVIVMGRDGRRYMKESNGTFSPTVRLSEHIDASRLPGGLIPRRTR